MQSNTTGLSMELLFDTIQLILITFIVVIQGNTSQKIREIQLNQSILDERLASDLQDIEKGLVRIHEKLESIPDIFKDDIHRSLLSLREDLQDAKPMKSNNWDSVREAFKGPVRIEINERN